MSWDLFDGDNWGDRLVGYACLFILGFLLGFYLG